MDFQLISMSMKNLILADQEDVTQHWTSVQVTKALFGVKEKNASEKHQGERGLTNPNPHEILGYQER